MMTNHQCKSLFALAALVMALLVLPGIAAAEVPARLPDPDGKPADQGKQVKVFILLGQSNMLGFGRVDRLQRPVGGGWRQGEVPRVQG